MIRSPKRFSLILTAGSALLLCLALGAGSAAADSLAPILWQMGLGAASDSAPSANLTPAVSAAPGSVNAPAPILWQMGVGN